MSTETTGWKRMPDGELVRQLYAKTEVYVVRVYPHGPPWRWVIEKHVGAASAIIDHGEAAKRRRAQLFAIRKAQALVDSPTPRPGDDSLMPSTPQIGLTTLTDRQRELLRLIQIDGSLATFSSDERIPDWPVLKKVMLALGSRWVNRKGFLFPDDVDGEGLLSRAIEFGEYIDPKEADLYETPEGLSRRVVDLSRPSPSSRILEPSAGRGALVKAAIERPYGSILCVEALEQNCKKLRWLAIEQMRRVHRGDFLELQPIELGRFDIVLMNPPFSKRADIAHVLHALSFLEKGGRLVAIMSAGVQFRKDKRAASIRDRARLIEANPPGSFKESGTTVNTCTVVIEKE